jgi:hypothetical protein
MPAKIIFDNKTEIPEHLRDAANEVDGKFELDATPVLKKNKELLGKNATLQSRAEEAEAAKETAEATAAEWKGKAKLPSGKRIVDADVAELGEAAKTAGVAKDEIGALKTEVETLKTEKVKGERTEARSKAADAIGLDGRKFAKLAETEDFDIEFEGEKPFAVIKGADSAPIKTAFSEFVEKHDKFSLVLDALKSGKKKPLTPFPIKETPAPTDLFARIRENEKKLGEQSKTRTVDEAFGRVSLV